MTPALEHTRDLHERLAARIDELARLAASLTEEAGADDVANALWMIGADLAGLLPIVEELQDRERFPLAVPTQPKQNGKGDCK